MLEGKYNLLYHKFEDERNIFRASNAWSINLAVLDEVDVIVYETLNNFYWTTKTRALEFGNVQNYQNEKKLYLPLVYWQSRKQRISDVEERRRALLGDSWYDVLAPVINSDYMSKIGNYLRERRTKTIVYPAERDVFRALQATHFKQIKVVILGQDPYHDGSANGLAFGFKLKWVETQKGVTTKPLPKSLDVIFKEVERDCYNGLYLNSDPTLQSWADQGVLLLNTVLTVERGVPKSHANIGWQRFTKIVLWELLKDISPKVYMLWGNDAQSLFQEVWEKVNPTTEQVSNALVLKAKHPAADLYGEVSKADFPNTFAGNGHFSQANKFLKIHKRQQIKW